VLSTGTEGMLTWCGAVLLCGSNAALGWETRLVSQEAASHQRQASLAGRQHPTLRTKVNISSCISIVIGMYQHVQNYCKHLFSKSGALMHRYSALATLPTPLTFDLPTNRCNLLLEALMVLA